MVLNVLLFSVTLIEFFLYVVDYYGEKGYLKQFGILVL